MIKTGGENVASREVEEMIYRLPAVSEVAVVGLPDAKWVEAVTAIVVLKTGQVLTEAEVMAHCSEHMAHFKAPEARAVHRGATEEPEWQAAQARAAPALRLT